MWTGKRSAGEKERYEPWVERGAVTQNQGLTGVYLDGERRQLDLVSPGGYRWVPAVGESVLVLKENQGDGAQHVVGTCGLSVDGLSPGDVEISSGGTAGVRFSGEEAEIFGTLKYQGMTMEEYIKKVLLSMG